MCIWCVVRGIYRHIGYVFMQQLDCMCFCAPEKDPCILFLKGSCNGYKYSKCTSPVAAAASAAQFETVDVEYIGMHDNNIDYFKNNKLINTHKLLKN